MDQQPDIRGFFRADRAEALDFSKAPALVTSKQSVTMLLDGAGGVSGSRWEAVQEGFLGRARREDGYPVERLERAKARYDAWFGRRGLLGGDVLDLGGGWGLYRQWWAPATGHVFVVHDPGLERFVEGPHRTHRVCFERALGLPMTFVEGVGEELPYRDASFDTCLIASTLDHCADPVRVLAELYRCLKSGGRLIVIQESEGVRTSSYMHLMKRFLQLLGSPRKLVRKVRGRLTGPPMHLHEFDTGSLTALLKRTGLQNVWCDTLEGVYVLEGFK
jgi:SAM-dependent methyltransferase